MEALLINCVEKSLNQFTLNNAIFLCERLRAEFPSEVNLQLLARCYLTNNQAYSAYHVLRGSKMAQSRYLFALSCFKMNLLSEAEAVLLPTEACEEVPNGAAGHYLLGLIYRCNDRREKAVEYFRKALSIDPLFWAAYEELCILGAAEEANIMFGEEATCRLQELYLVHESSHLQTASDDQFLDLDGTFQLEGMNLTRMKHVQGHDLKDAHQSHHEEAVLDESVTPVISDCPSNVPFCHTPSPVPPDLSGIAPLPSCRNVQLKSNIQRGEGSAKSIIDVSQRKFIEDKSMKVPRRFTSDFRLRRSARIAARKNATASTCTLNPLSFHSSTDDKGQNEHIKEGKWLQTPGDASSDYTAVISNSSSIVSGITDTLDLMRHIGEGYRLLCMYRCQEALNVYQKLPQKHYNTAWILSQVGKAYFELVDYLNAGHVFGLAHQISPYALEGMDKYSTVLYHLKEDMKLSYLAQELIAVDRLAPESWCAVGNCYSLQKDHETALKIFLRAVKLNSRFAYAHTLCGHEYAALEDYENGEKCYQSALRVDVRHYNAWYGLGMIYFRKENFEFAEHHFQQALQLNPHSSVIMCYLGNTLHAQKKSNEAFQMLEKAIITDKRNPLPMYYKADMLLSLGIFDKALEVLEELKEYAPCESSIHALMGKVYKECKIYDKAMLHFGIALDLKPFASDAIIIKACMQTLLAQDQLESNFN
ncbi:cell division cycle protein 27 homolog B isoform X2 [Carica papaya]|uniref:cell division cycle protein 27 homolog B isoform X2 n=1 Tax=Carica papaya TaxID=3649 RepID=UPI000B8D1309|nr:cell division cycle protein 27 homolog B isoform X2 [Carica papaya]